MDEVMQHTSRLRVWQRSGLRRLLRARVKAALRAEEEDRLDILIADEVRAALREGRERRVTADLLRRMLREGVGLEYVV